MTMPVEPGDRDLEARLQTSWQRAMDRAEADIQHGDLVSGALGRARTPGRRLAARGGMVIAVLALVAVAVVAGQSIADRVAAPEPLASPSLAPGSPAPSLGTEPAIVPILDPHQTFPPSVDGQDVVPVGPAADARIASATDDSPIYVSGWLVERISNTQPCSALEATTKNAAFLEPDCVATQIGGTPGGPPSLMVFSAASSRLPLEGSPARVQPVLIEIHVHDPGCTDAACAFAPVVDRVVMLGSPSVAPRLLTVTEPPEGISAAQAADIARRRIQRLPLPSPGQLPVLRIAAGPAALVDEVGENDVQWEWVVHLLGDDGVSEHVVWMDYVDGTVVATGGGPATDATATMPVGGTALDDAFAAAQAQSIALYGEPLVLLQAQAGPSAQFGRDGTGWVWAVDFASDDGYQAYRAYVDYVSGEFVGSKGGSVTTEGLLP